MIRPLLVHFAFMSFLYGQTHAMLEKMSDKHYALIDAEYFDRKKFTKNCEKESKVYDNAEKLSDLISQDPTVYSGIFTNLASSNNLTKKSVAFKTLDRLIREDNPWMKKEFPSYIFKLKNEKKSSNLGSLFSLKSKSLFQQGVDGNEVYELSIGGLWLQKIIIGLEEIDFTENVGHENFALEQIERLVSSSKEEPQLTLLSEILATHCLRSLNAVRQNRSNKLTRWIGEFIIKLQESGENTKKPLAQNVLNLTYSYLNPEYGEQEDRIIFSVYIQNNLSTITREYKSFLEHFAK